MGKDVFIPQPINLAEWAIGDDYYTLHGIPTPAQVAEAIEALATIQLTTEIDAAWEAMMQPDAGSKWWKQYVARYTAIRMPAIIKDLKEE